MMASYRERGFLQPSSTFDFGDLVGVGDVRFAISVPSEEERVDDRTSVIQFVE